MRDFALEIRMELLRVQPRLGVEQADGLIREIPFCFQDITHDNADNGETAWREFYNFSLAEGVALVTIYRQAEIEVLTFAADQSLVHLTQHLAMVDVDEFLRLVRGRFTVPEAGLRFPMSQALPWLERVEEV